MIISLVLGEQSGLDYLLSNVPREDLHSKLASKISISSRRISEMIFFKAAFQDIHGHGDPLPLNHQVGTSDSTEEQDE
jgi:hypothetical protein